MYARPPAGKIEAVALDKALIETAELFEKDGRNSGRISTTRSIQPGIWVAMDPVHVRQILWNLLLNAAESIDGKFSAHRAATRFRLMALSLLLGAPLVPAYALIQRAVGFQLWGSLGFGGLVIFGAWACLARARRLERFAGTPIQPAGAPGAL